MAGSAPWILGLAASHNGSACLLRGSELVVAIQEERLLRYKRARLRPGLDAACIRYCLDYAGIDASDLAAVGICFAGPTWSTLDEVGLSNRLLVARHRIPTFTVPHHLGHAFAVKVTSGFDDTAILVVDGSGSTDEQLVDAERAVIVGLRHGHEWLSMYRASGSEIVPLEKQLLDRNKHPYQRSYDPAVGMPTFGGLGEMYSAVGRQIFGSPDDGPGKVMGLAPYGRPTIPTDQWFEIRDRELSFKDGICARYPHNDRWPARKQEYQDLAASVQAALEDGLLSIAHRLREQSGCSRLCYAGGVALNSVANERLVNEVGFRDVFIMPAAEDSGTSIGAAYHAFWKLTGELPRKPLVHDAVGRPYSPESVRSAIQSTPSVVAESTPRAGIAAKIAGLLDDGHIVGLFTGRSELGPRALGQRSILYDPRRPGGKDLLNERVKHREGFRPFAPVILLEETPSWFDVTEQTADSQYMLRVMKFRPGKQELVPAVTHVDGTGRVQTVTAAANGLLHEVVAEFFRRTGTPIVLNTSFNVAGEPIVESPSDALWCLLYTGVDCVAFEDVIVTKQPGYTSILDLGIELSIVNLAIEYPVGTTLHRGPAGEVAPATGRIPLPNELPLSLCGDGERHLDELLGLRPSWVRFRVQTEWGPAVQVGEIEWLPILQCIDGGTGWQLCDRLSSRLGKAVDQTWLIRLLGRFRRASMIRFRDGTAVADGSPEPVRLRREFKPR